MLFHNGNNQTARCQSFSAMNKMFTFCEGSKHVTVLKKLEFFKNVFSVSVNRFFHFLQHCSHALKKLVKYKYSSSAMCLYMKIYVEFHLELWQKNFNEPIF